MTGSAGLERRYRRLLAWYPRAFREEYAEEMVAVMMAGASRGQERPRARESLNLLRSAIWARLRPARSPGPNPVLQDALALFSLIAPVFLVMVAALEVTVGFRLPASPSPFLSHREVGGLALLAQPGFGIAAGSLLLVAAAAALGMRRLALAATGLAVLYAVGLRYATSNGYGLPLPLEMLATSACFLEVVARGKRGWRAGLPGWHLGRGAGLAGFPRVPLPAPARASLRDRRASHPVAPRPPGDGLTGHQVSPRPHARALS